jgi:hypothetical protein
VDGETGVLVPEATVEAFAAGLERAARLSFDPATIRSHALRFSRERHVEQMTAVIEETVTAPPGHRW